MSLRNLFAAIRIKLGETGHYRNLFAVIRIELGEVGLERNLFAALPATQIELGETGQSRNLLNPDRTNRETNKGISWIESGLKLG